MMAQQQHSLNTGRNLPVATAVGLLLLGSIIASLAYSPVVFAVLDRKSTRLNSSH